MKYYNKFQWGLKPYRLASHKIWHVSPEERDEFLKLDWNEATIPPSPRVSERIHQLLEHENFYNLYPSMVNDELNDLLAKYVGLPDDYFLYFVGSDSVQEVICRSYMAPGNSILILGPSYDNFRLTAESTGVKLNFFEMTDEFEFIAEDFEAAIDSICPTFVYICSPNNPTGHLHGIDYIEYLLKKYPETMFLIDEAYCEFAKKTVCSLTKTYENILVTRTMSKAWALANFRFGYVISNPVNIEHMAKIRNPKNINSFTQAAVCGALSDVDYMWAFVDEVNKAKQYFYDEMKKRSEYVTVYFGYANSLLLKFTSAEEKDAMYHFLDDHKIIVRPLKQSKKLEKCFRISIGTMEQMQRVVACMDEYWAAK